MSTYLSPPFALEIIRCGVDRPTPIAPELLARM